MCYTKPYIRRKKNLEQFQKRISEVKSKYERLFSMPYPKIYVNDGDKQYLTVFKVRTDNISVLYFFSKFHFRYPC